MTPGGLDAGAKTATLDFDGTTVVAITRPAARRADHLAGAEPDAERSPRFRPTGSSGAALQETGPWAMFRLLGRARMKRTGPAGRFTLTFSQGEREAVFEVRADSIVNPFAPGPLQEFRCPTVQ